MTSLDPAYEQWYQKLVSELKEIASKEGKAVLPYKYQMGKAIQRARREWDKAHPPTGPEGWTKARHNIMERLKRDLTIARSDLYSCLRFVELGLRLKKDGWKSFDEFADRRFLVTRGDSLQGETRVRGRDLTWKEVKEQVLRRKRRQQTEPAQHEEPPPKSNEATQESVMPTLSPEIATPASPSIPSRRIYMELSEEADNILTQLATKWGRSRSETAQVLLEGHLKKMAI